MKYFIKTFGCAMNVSDSERIASFLESNEFKLAKNEEGANLVVFNTCGIRQAAENRAYSIINNLKKKNKNILIVMTGCLAHRKDVQQRMKKSVDLFCEIKDFEKEFLCHPEFISGSRRALEPDEMLKPQKNSYAVYGARQVQHDRGYLSIIPKHTNHFQAYVPIMTGCNNFCSYCVVPYARGREVSRPAKEIISEIKDLVKKGYRQITLLGQNVNSYKSQNVSRQTSNVIGNIDFAQLLKMIDKIPGKFWINFVSSHPKDMSDELIETVAKCSKVCEWIHLPVQAGDDKILFRMNRKYTQQHYLKRISKIKSAFSKFKPNSNYAISSDIIVGFPGETKKQFLESAKVMEKAKFDMVYFGQFSPRPGTAAWNMKDNVSQNEKIRREKFLNEILKKTSLRSNKKYVGKKIEVLVEKLGTKAPIGDLVPKQSFVYFGKTRSQKNVKILSNKKGLVGKFTKVLIIKANTWNLEGKV